MTKLEAEMALWCMGLVTIIFANPEKPLVGLMGVGLILLAIVYRWLFIADKEED